MSRLITPSGTDCGEITEVSWEDSYRDEDDEGNPVKVVRYSVWVRQDKDDDEEE